MILYQLIGYSDNPIFREDNWAVTGDELDAATRTVSKDRSTLKEASCMKEVVKSPAKRERTADLVEGLKHCDLWISMRKFANPDIALVARVLYDMGPATLAQLREETKLTTNILNHDLIEMRKSELVVKKDKEYAITKYGALLVEAIEEIKKEIFVASATGLFQPISVPRKEEQCVIEA